MLFQNPFKVQYKLYSFALYATSHRVHLSLTAISYKSTPQKNAMLEEKKSSTIIYLLMDNKDSKTQKSSSMLKTTLTTLVDKLAPCSKGNGIKIQRKQSQISSCKNTESTPYS